MRNLWASFDFLVHFLIIFFIVQSFKNEILSKILDIQKYNIVRHWFSSKNWIFAIFFKKVSIDGFTHYLWKILLIFTVQSFKNEISSRILDTQKYNIVRHWFSSKNWIFSIFFKKVSIDGFTHFWSKIHPKFSKNRLFHIPQYCPKFEKWNFIKNPWYTKIQHCTTLIFLKKLDFFDFF